MKAMLPLILASVFLYGCPDVKNPKLPPSVPEPKASVERQSAHQPSAAIWRSACSNTSTACPPEIR